METYGGNVHVTLRVLDLALDMSDCIHALAALNPGKEPSVLIG
jgi:hypothetical protein